MLLERHIGPSEDGTELKALMKNGMKLSSTMIKRLKAAQGIYVNGLPVYTNYICRTDDLVCLDISAAEPALEVVAEHGDISILYEDDIFIAVNKPAGMLSHPSRAQFTGSLMGYVAGYLSESGSPACHALNRLDRLTSGIVLFAKSSYAKALSLSAMQGAEKVYLAIAFGRFEDNSGVIDLPIKRITSGRMERCVAPDGARAITHYELLDSLRLNGSELSLLSLKLKTGRTHQLRVHCASLGHPLLGDQIYCTAQSKALSDELGLRGQLLHAQSLRFTHPVSGKPVNILCPVTRADMCRIIKGKNPSF